MIAAPPHNPSVDKAGHMNPSLRVFLNRYRHHRVPIKIAMKRGFDGERYKPETGNRIDINHWHV